MHLRMKEVMRKQSISNEQQTNRPIILENLENRNPRIEIFMRLEIVRHIQNYNAQKHFKSIQYLHRDTGCVRRDYLRYGRKRYQCCSWSQ